ncbi:unnamed protein product [Clonostachys rosea]|uniref:Heterokaryon incompatibility domain-containing protein n=1 Tax=Bionectria ochroleuca TaxID=29856 RepID=A0ABY6U0V6_BIOOC|nr:unnamed protein product [Clonostachys rosea]
MHRWLSTCSRIQGGSFPSEEWYNLISAHSRRMVTNVEDQLPAIAGISSILGENYERAYLAGLWSHDLIYGLSWYKHHMADKHPKAKDNIRDQGKSYLAPSWSWASWPNGMATYASRDLFHHEENLMKIIDAKCKPTSKANGPFGKVAPGGFLKLEGPIKRAKVRPASNELYGSWVSEVVDAENDKIVGSIYLDNQPDKSQSFEIWCLRILRFAFSARCSYETLCLGLVRNGEGCYRRVGLVGLFKETWRYEDQGQMYENDDSSDEDQAEEDKAEEEKNKEDTAAEEVCVWDKKVWDTEPSCITVV